MINNQEGLKLQYALSQHDLELGWREVDIDVIDRILGRAALRQSTGKGLRIWSYASLLVIGRRYDAGYPREESAAGKAARPDCEGEC